MPTWKSSVLPLLFHGLSDPTQARQSLIFIVKAAERNGEEVREPPCAFEYGTTTGFKVVKDNLLAMHENSPRSSVDTQDWQEEILNSIRS